MSFFFSLREALIHFWNARNAMYIKNLEICNNFIANQDPHWLANEEIIRLSSTITLLIMNSS